VRVRPIGGLTTAIAQLEAEFLHEATRVMSGSKAMADSLMSKALHFWQISLTSSGDTATSMSECELIEIAHIIHTLFIGAINSWINGDLTSDELRQRVRKGITLILAGARRSNND
jgi:hypothetical protein